MRKKKVKLIFIDLLTKAMEEEGCEPMFALLDPLTHEVRITNNVFQWGPEFQAGVEAGHHRVRKDHLNGYFISTVFVGVNAAFPGEEANWFETMVFSETGPANPRFTRVYATWDQAMRGHLEELEIIRYGNF